MRTLITNFHWWESDEPQQMLVEAGKVLWRRAHSTEHAESEHVTDLNGATIMPAFIDSHCHILPTGLDLQKLHLGVANSHQDVLDLVRVRHDQQPDGWMLAVHYDQTKYEGGAHLTRHQLDAISPTRPMLLRHVNGHASVANTAALQAAGVNAETPDPDGGTFGRDASGDLDGTLFEEAHEQVSRTPPTPTMEEMADAILLAGRQMADLGIVCASDMMTGRFDIERELEAYRLAADRGCPIQLRLYVQWKDAFGARARFVMPRNDDAMRVAGIKIFADGAIGSATAAIYGAYTGASPNGIMRSRRAVKAVHVDREVSGQLMYSPERLLSMIQTASAAGYQVAVHAIGDYATDLVLDGFEATDAPQRHRLEHGMLLSNAQIQRIADLGCFLTFQPEFLMRFGHSYKRQLGPDRAAKLKRTRSVLNAGIKLSFSSDRPIVAGDPRDGVRTAVNRPDGFDQTENCTLAEAIRAYTVEGARVNGDDPATATLKAGTPARYTTLDPSS